MQSAITMEKPVVVVGAGPAGLTAALELARNDCPVRIIETRTESPEHSKALSINTRTLELMEASGITERLLAAGLRAPGAQVRSTEKILFRVDYTRIGHRYNFMLVLPQSETEAIFEQRLSEYGVTVERGTALTGYRQTAAGIEATVTHAGQAAELTASYLVGADGAHSVVRRTAGIAFPGTQMPTRWSLADVRMDSPWEIEPANLQIGSQGMVFALRFKEGVFRLGSDRPNVLQRLPSDMRVHEVLWESDFEVSHCQAETYRAGRVLLAGDAAHVHAPLGARGMNMSIEDAVLLVKRLLAGDLDRYAAERLRAGASALSMIKVQNYLATSTTRMSRLVRRHVVPMVIGCPPLHRRLARRMLGLGYA